MNEDQPPPIYPNCRCDIGPLAGLVAEVRRIATGVTETLFRHLSPVDWARRNRRYARYQRKEARMETKRRRAMAWRKKRRKQAQ